MSAPTIIAGPAIITRGPHTWYTEGDITVSLSRDTWTHRRRRVHQNPPGSSELRH